MAEQMSTGPLQVPGSAQSPRAATYAPGTFRQTARFYQVLGELAHKKEQLTRVGEERGNSLIIAQLRGELTQLAPAAQA